ncbi:Hypothetical protein D9617_4g000500 [Elsinoe fawcettii]|nr:Hypothetical protein D9617_4g000500 [Elsinoe fawcettii]
MHSFALIPLFALSAFAQTTPSLSDDLLSSISSSLFPSATGFVNSVFNQGDDDSSTTTTSNSRTRLFTSANFTATGTRTGTTTTDPTRPTLTIYGLNNIANTYAASVVAANQAATTFDVICSRGAFLCPSGIAFQMTQAPTSLQLRNTATTLGVTLTESYTCALQGTTSASCRYSVRGEGPGGKTSTQIETTYSRSLLPYATVVVTAGQEKLVAASTVPAPAASESQGAAGRGMTVLGGRERGVWWGMCVAMGAVGVLAFVL